jgi:hypothetical protein
MRGSSAEDYEYNPEIVYYLSDVQICLHDEERIQSICPGSVRVIEKVLDFRKGCLSEPSTSIFWGQL